MNKLGLVCMLSNKGMKKGVTGIKQLNNMSQVDINNKLLDATIYNLNYTYECIEFCINNNIGMYRVSSNIIPYNDFWNWLSYDIIIKKLNSINELAISNNIRLTIHPDQFTVLNSLSDNVINNSIEILKHHYILSCYLGINDIIIHTGSTQKDYKQRFINTVNNKLPKEIKAKLLLENCHNVNISDVIDICYQCDIKPCFDAHHHHIIKPTNTPLNNILVDIFKLWNYKVPLAHISSGRNSTTDKAHNDYILQYTIDNNKFLFDSFDVEVEAKKKEIAVLELMKAL